MRDRAWVKLECGHKRNLTATVRQAVADGVTTQMPCRRPDCPHGDCEIVEFYDPRVMWAEQREAKKQRRFAELATPGRSLPQSLVDLNMQRRKAQVDRSV